MKRLLTAVCVMLLASAVAEAQPNVSFTTGQLSINLSSYGRVRAGLGSSYVAANRELDRMSFDVGQSDQAVFDYNYDADSTAMVAQLISIAGVDSAMESMADNEYSMLPPKVKVRTTVMAWKDQKYFMVRYRIIADTQGLGSLYMGAVVIPKPGLAYGGETVKYNGARKVTYYYREGEASYWGFKVLSPGAMGVSILDWDVFSTDPNSDVATDSTRNAMLKNTGYKDSVLVAGSNGSVFTVNVGKAAFTNKGDSVTHYYAVAYGASEAELFAAMDSATAKYPKIVTSVQRGNTLRPDGFALEQNYPNPFNPSTQIRFSVGASSMVSLRVFDALGREVRSLVNRQLDAGVYTVNLSGEKLGSGMYYYTLQAGNFTETKKMMLVK